MEMNRIMSLLRVVDKSQRVFYLRSDMVNGIESMELTNPPCFGSEVYLNSGKVLTIRLTPDELYDQLLERHKEGLNESDID